MKRVFDTVVSVLAMVFALPILMAIAWIVKHDSPEPALFRQVRSGLRGREFVLYKFRTMRSDAVLERNPDGSARVTAGDARITRVGRPLREFGLDELPQLFNILRGDMSLVGPRPYMPIHTAMLPDWARRRLDMRPGLVGLTEVSGRNALPWARRLELDAYYVDHWSLWLDFIILARAVPVVLFRRGVYTRPSPDPSDGALNEPSSHES
jgi:lipopolysaccharide/colanic/teichoic acid biosynthesis glycosyltransferase